MAIQVVCPNGHALKIKDHYAGKTGSCPICKARIQVPAPVESVDDLIMDVLQPETVGLLSQSFLARRNQAGGVYQESPSVKLRFCPFCRRELTTKIRVCPDCSKFGLLARVSGGTQIPLPRPLMMVGRRESCDIVLRFPSVSGHHAELKLHRGYWYIEDRGSKNGTEVNGARVNRQLLKPNDIITFGSEKYQIQYDPTALGATGQPSATPSDETDEGAPSLEEAGAVPGKNAPFEVGSKSGVFNLGDTKKCYACHKRDQIGVGPNWMYCKKCAARLAKTGEMVDQWVNKLSRDKMGPKPRDW
jgi:adenylate cyclase